MQGQWVTVSFYVAAGANFSSANSDLSVSLIWSNGTNQGAANMVAGSWTGQAQVPLTANQPVGTGGANGTASAAAVQQINASPTRYSWTGLVPSTAAQIGLLLSYTPVGTAGSADYIQIYGIQIEPGTVAGPFEHRDVQVELEIAQRYAFVANEPANGVALTTGMNTGASAQQFFIPLPVQMLKAPTVTVVGSSPAWKTNQAGVATATTLVAGGTHTVNAITLTSNSAGTAGQATMLQGGGGNGRIVVSADL
jgi:hypothetical protein